MINNNRIIGAISQENNDRCQTNRPLTRKYPQYGLGYGIVISATSGAFDGLFTP